MERDSLDGFASNFEFKYVCLGWVKEYREVNPDEENEEEDQLFNDDELEQQPDEVTQDEKKNQ